MAEGGIAGALANLDKKDSWQVHFMDTMRGGAFLNNWRTVEILTKEAPERVLELEQFGAVFDRTPDGLIMQRPFGGHTYRRLNRRRPNRPGAAAHRSGSRRGDRHEMLYGSHHD